MIDSWLWPLDPLPERALKRAAREAVGLGPYDRRVGWRIVTRSVAAPVLSGEPFYFETRGGSRIRHPSAYGRKGWNNMVYVPSSRMITVGRWWRPTLPPDIDEWHPDSAIPEDYYAW